MVNPWKLVHDDGKLVTEAAGLPGGGVLVRVFRQDGERVSELAVTYVPDKTLEDLERLGENPFHRGVRP